MAHRYPRGTSPPKVAGQATHIASAALPVETSPIPNMAHGGVRGASAGIGAGTALAPPETLDQLSLSEDEVIDEASSRVDDEYQLRFWQQAEGILAQHKTRKKKAGKKRRD